ncbi:glutathione-dependent formaldehyde-activating enzyme [Diaporthe sp. PMI_573]|nr:glutathione-dependent formaldehyde-activating enzyme [Diaporthaceae sp. PMI_573]
MALNLTGTCTCRKLRYTVKLDSADSARTSLCHCSSCKKAFATNFGSKSKYSRGAPKLCKHENVVATLAREFCDNCGSFTCEYGLPPKGEFFCKDRSSWMPEIPDFIHKQMNE